MTLEIPTADPSAENLKKLELLMGEFYDGTEMSDYLSYLSPENASEEISAFEAKLEKGSYSKEELVKKFKSHLEYLAA